MWSCFQHYWHLEWWIVWLKLSRSTYILDGVLKMDFPVEITKNALVRNHLLQGNVLILRHLLKEEKSVYVLTEICHERSKWLWPTGQKGIILVSATRKSMFNTPSNTYFICGIPLPPPFYMYDLHTRITCKAVCLNTS